MPIDRLYFKKTFDTHFIFFDLKRITYDFLNLNLNIFNSHKIKNQLWGQICPVSTGWHLLSDFIIEG